MHVDYMAPGYFKSFNDFLTAEGETGWHIDQLIRGEASSDWIIGEWIYKDPSNIPWGGWVDVTSGSPVFSNFMAGEDFRTPWRTILNYVWHGNPEYTWNPTTHQVEPTTNTYEADAGIRHAQFLTAPQAAPWNNPCVGFGGGPDLTYQGPSTLQWEITPDGSGSSAFTLNWIPGTGTPAAVAAQDLDLLGQLYRQCVIEWDVTTEGDGYLSSVPVYFHGWFRLLGMLVASGNALNPNKMLPKPNLKIYRDIELKKTFAYTGDAIEYNLRYRNYGSVDATGTIIVEQVPDDFIFVSADNGGVYDAATHTVTWNIGKVPGFKTGGLDATIDSVSYQTIINETASGRYCTTAEITCTNGFGHVSNEYPNFISPTLSRNCIDVVARALQIEKSADREKANDGNTVTYTIDFENSVDAGWIDGGRPGVNVSFAHPPLATPAATDQSGIKIRLFHDAVEPYIDYGNYRISYFINDPGLKCYVGDAGCTTGWDIASSIYEGGDPAGVKVSHELITPGSDANGSWNQKLVVQFAPLLVTTTPHISNYYGLTQRVHLGGAEPLRAVWRVFPNNYNATDWSDDWSWNPGAEGPDDGLFSPVTPDWTDPANPNIPVTKWHQNSCETAPTTIDNVLVEEYDGYVWRRVFGNGPIPGRDITNVIIKDTLPVGFTFDSFVGPNPFGIPPTIATITSGPATGQQVISWSIPKLQANQGGQIVYTGTVNFPSGSTCPTADEELINTSWIYGDNESKTDGVDTVIITCAIQPEVIEPSSLIKMADKATYSTGDNITYTLAYEQTHGSISTPSLNDLTDWTGSGFSASGGTLTATSNNTNKITYDYAYGQNGYIETTVAQTDYAAYRVLFREGSATPIAVSIKKEWGNNLVINYIENGTSVHTQTISIGAPISPYSLKVHLYDDNLRLWINEDTTQSPIYSRTGVPIGTGFGGLANGSPADASGSHSFTDLKFHFDAAFNLEITDPIPSEISYLSATAGGTNNAGTITWSVPSGKGNPVLFGDVTTVEWTGTVDACNTILENVAYVDIMGHPAQSIAGQEVVDCGVSACPDAPDVTDVTYCKGDVASALTATGTAIKWYDAASGGNLITPAPTPLTTSGSTTSYWATQTVGGCESPRVELVVTVYETTAPTVANVEVCKDGTVTPISISCTLGKLYDDTYSELTTPYTPSNTTAGTTTFYATCEENGCPSDFATFTFEVKETTPPSVSNIEYCKDETASVITITGTSTKIYDDTYTLVPPPVTPNTGTGGSTTLYATETIDGCESDYAPFTLTIHETPTPSGTTPVNYCKDETAIALTATGTGSSAFYWGLSPVKGNTPNGPSGPIPPTGSIGSTSYYVSQTENNCESEFFEIVVNISEPTAPTVTPTVEYCQDDLTATPLTATANGTGTLYWYEDLTTDPGTATAPTPSTVTPQVKSYWGHIHNQSFIRYFYRVRSFISYSKSIVYYKL
jgi:uncharacterized repeat protein (TIGR01451 family)